MESSQVFRSLIRDYVNHESLVCNTEEEENLQKIMHGHQDLTEPFLGPSHEVKRLKKRLRVAEY